MEPFKKCKTHQFREEIYSACDFITIHIPLLDDTKKMLNKEALQMKDGVVILNFARDLLVDEEAILTALLKRKSEEICN